MLCWANLGQAFRLSRTFVIEVCIKFNILVNQSIASRTRARSFVSYIRLASFAQYGKQKKKKRRKKKLGEKKQNFTENIIFDAKKILTWGGWGGGAEVSCSIFSPALSRKSSGFARILLVCPKMVTGKILQGLQPSPLVCLSFALYFIIITFYICVQLQTTLKVSLLTQNYSYSLMHSAILI